MNTYISIRRAHIIRSRPALISILTVILFVVLFSAVAPLAAHTFAPSLLELSEQQDGIVVHFKQPQVRVLGSNLRPVLPPSCREIDGPDIRSQGTGIVTTWRVVCGRLVGEEIGVEGIGGSGADVLLRLQLGDGRSSHHVLTADRPSIEIPRSPGVLDIAGLYGKLGVEHILSGFDHLLFVLGLVLLVEGRRRLVGTVTAFTAGHSITLALAALGLVHVPPGPTEAAIALSIFVLAVELARPREKESLLRRSPWSMAALFGLLHGLGFVGALSEIGLPEHEIPAALFSFNLGIELGQLFFVVVVLVATFSAERSLGWLPRSWSVALAGLPVYGIGTLATFWFLERLSGML